MRPMAVSHAVNLARRVLEGEIGPLWIEGETTSVNRASSGHLYFALKDQRAQIRAVMWRSDAQKLKFRLQDGQLLRVRGQMTLYEAGGKFQLYVRYAEPAGMGAEALALEQLKRKLAAEGLFDRARKRRLPWIPRRIGVVTSKSGAAVRDIIRTVHRRFPVPILVADASVQGASAARDIVRALHALARTDVDVIIVGRGGGSASDLAAFNDEAVVRAVATCPIPTISAVGHEVDTSLCDLAADRYASTPTAAGELAVPVRAELAELLAEEERRLHRELQIRVENARQQLDHLTGRAHHVVTGRLARERQALGALDRRLQACHPRAQLVENRARLSELQSALDTLINRRLQRARRYFADATVRLDPLMNRRLQRARHDFASATARLEALSPLRVLQRGYALARTEERVLTDAETVTVGDPVTIRLARGALDCRVEAVHPAPEHASIEVDAEDERRDES